MPVGKGYTKTWAEENVETLVALNQQNDGFTNASDKDVTPGLINTVRESQRKFVSDNYQQAKEQGSYEEEIYWTVREMFARTNDEKYQQLRNKKIKTYNLPEELETIQKPEDPTSEIPDADTAPPRSGLVLVDMFGENPEGPNDEVNETRAKIGNIVQAWVGQHGKSPTQQELKNLIYSSQGFTEELGNAYAPYLNNYKPVTG